MSEWWHYVVPDPPEPPDYGPDSEEEDQEHAEIVQGKNEPMNDAQYSEMVALLNDISARLGRLEQRMAAAPAGRASGAASPGPAAGEVATDEDLASKWGDPEIRKDPTRWTGQSYVGARYSDCPPDYLRSLAGLLDWQADRADEKSELTKGGAPRSKFLRADAARARGWGARNERAGGRAGRGAPPEEVPTGDMFGGDDDIPF